MSFYNILRPVDWNEVYGQQKAVKLITTKLTEGTLPNVIMLVGPTGSGKTTIARIIARKLSPKVDVERRRNYSEINCAEVRGIDSVREMQESVPLSPMGGPKKVYVLDEIVQLPKTTQQAFLQLLENVPNHCQFILCTSDTTGLLSTFMDRCFIVTLGSLTTAALTKILVGVWSKVKDSMIDMALLAAIITKAEGSGRKAVQMLEAAAAFEELEDQIQAVGSASVMTEEKVRFLATALMNKDPWEKIYPILKTIDKKDCEGLRHQLLDYANAFLLSQAPFQKKQLAYLLIRAFEDLWPVNPKSRLIAAAWDCCRRQ